MNDLINLELQNCIANAATAGIYNTLESIRQEYTCPSAVYRPKLSVDGDQYCALYGEDLQSGVAGFGTSAAKAMSDFDRNWNTRLSALVPSTPTDNRAAQGINPHE